MARQGHSGYGGGLAHLQANAEALHFAARLHAAGDLSQAADACKTILKRAPNHGGARRLLGLIAMDRGDWRDAIDQLRRALAAGADGPGLRITLARALAAFGRTRDAVAQLREALVQDPASPEAHYDLASLCAQAGDSVGAAEHFGKAAQARPQHAEAWCNFGVASRALGRSQAAAAAFEQAVRARPDFPRAWSNLGAALIDLGRYDDAERALDEALRRDPASLSAHRNKAIALRMLGRIDEALALLQAAMATHPGDVATTLELGETLARGGDAAGAVKAFAHAAALAPDQAKPIFALGQQMARLGETAAATEAFERALALDPKDSCGAALALAQLGAAPPPAAPSPDFVAELFDGYAARFDQELVGSLGYQAPQILRALFDAASGHDPDQAEPLVALDLGCGTGLGGLAFRDLCRRLEGVDLSAKMIEGARERAIYDDLTVGEAVAALEATPPRSLDLILAADVLTYLGDLGPLFAAARRALRPDGWWLFSVEDDEGRGGPFTLKDSNRYGHGQAALTALAATHGFEILALRPATTRHDRGDPVAGWAALFRAGA